MVAKNKITDWLFSHNTEDLRWIKKEDDSVEQQLDKNGTVEWRKIGDNVSVGDTVYLYYSKKYQCIRYKTVVEDIGEKTIILKNQIKFTDSQTSKLKFEKLSKYSLKAPQGRINLNKKNELLEYIKSVEKNSISDRSGGNDGPINLILFGPPGTGKTFKTIDIAASIINNSDLSIDNILKKENKEEHAKNSVIFNKALKDKNIYFVTFHQNYSYEEFVGGLRPVLSKNNSKGELQFEWKPGIFIDACAKALSLAANDETVKSKDLRNGSLQNWFLEQCKNYDRSLFKYDQSETVEKVVLIIDEINRANISRVFGELITLIEDDKRINQDHQLIISLPNGKSFGVPKNLIILGTMNTADKSLALLDVALRRRFEFKGLYPNESLVEGTTNSVFKKLNEAIIEAKGVDYQIGHSYFIDKVEDDFEELFNNKIIPLLNEYFMNDSERIKKEILDKIDDLKDCFNFKDGLIKYSK